MINANGKAMVMAAFLADSLALGAHWIYDTKNLFRRFGRVAGLLNPELDTYHPGKKKGQFTHYGDQMLVLLESLAEKKTFDPGDFSQKWQHLFSNYKGYIDQATRGTLAGLASGKKYEEAGSSSDELAGASRISPVIYLFRNDLKNLLTACKTQTIMTHNSPNASESSVFFARVTWEVLHGTSPAASIEKISQAWIGLPLIKDWVRAGLDSIGMDSVSAIFKFGQSCHTPENFPGVIHLISKYENDLKEGLIQSVMAGGDNAARGMMVGTVLGAYQGLESLPENWLSELDKREEIMKLLDMIS